MRSRLMLNAHGCLFIAEGASLAASRASLQPEGQSSGDSPLTIDERGFLFLADVADPIPLAPKLSPDNAKPSGVTAMTLSEVARASRRSASLGLKLPLTQQVSRPSTVAWRMIPSPR